MGYDCRFWQITATKLHVTWATIDTTLWNLTCSGKANQCIASFASILHTPRQNTSGHYTKSLTPQELSSSSKCLLNWCLLILFHRSDTEYNRKSTPCCSFPNCKLNIFAALVLMIHKSLKSTTRQWCVHITILLIQWQATQKMVSVLEIMIGNWSAIFWK